MRAAYKRGGLILKGLGWTYDFRRYARLLFLYFIKLKSLLYNLVHRLQKQSVR